MFFRLKLNVEFQQPKAPLRMYLEAQESDTIDALQTKVCSAHLKQCCLVLVIFYYLFICLFITVFIYFF